MRSDRERLLDILEAIDKIEQRPSSDIDAFADDEMQQVWVIHHLQIVAPRQPTACPNGSKPIISRGVNSPTAKRPHEQ